jgi:transcriptional regulator with XRE-family HTH domain
VPARPKPLTPVEPRKRAPGVPDGLWSFPRNLADEANARDLTQKDLAELAGVSQSMISRWMHYEVENLKTWTVLKLEGGMRLAHGELTLPPRLRRNRSTSVELHYESDKEPDATSGPGGMRREVAAKDEAGRSGDETGRAKAKRSNA